MAKIVEIANLCALISLIGYVESFQYNAQGRLRDPWILPRSVRVTSDPDSCNVTVAFTSSEAVGVQWTTKDGFSPTDLDKQTIVSTEVLGTDTLASVVIPFQIPLDSLRLHLTNSRRGFEVHLEFDVYHGITDTYLDINPYTLFVPPNTDVGISSRGRTQFHVFANTSGTHFIFGMLQAELTSLTSDIKDNVLHEVAYSFLPDNENGKIRLLRRIATESAYKADIALNAPEVYKNGGIISITCACSSQNSIVRRLDNRQLLYLKSKPGRVPMPKNSVGIIPMPSSINGVRAVQSENALIRCKAVGNPTPKITLHRKSGGVTEPYAVPSYTTSQAFETLTVFQFINVASEEAGTYVCRATVGGNSKEKDHALVVVSSSLSEPYV